MQSINRRSVLGVALAAAGAAGLAACGGGRSDSTATAGGSGSAGGGFPANATIGVALPWLGTQNWSEAQTMFQDQLKAAGFTPMVQAADNKVPQQQQQITSMVQGGAKAIVVGAVDGTQLGAVLTQAKQSGVKIIAYDRLLQNTDAVDACVQFGAIKTGQLQGQALLDGLKAWKGEKKPYMIELFAGGPADPNAKLFFEGAMQVLQPKIDDGSLKVGSGQVSFTQCATADWDNAKAQSRMDSLLSGNYSSTKIDGVLSPNDGIARAILTSCKNAGQPNPVVTGLDAENESVKLVWAGTQYETTAKPTTKLVEKSIELIKAWQAGTALPAASEQQDNGKIKVPTYQLDPIAVTKANIKEVFKDDPVRSALLK